MFIVSHIENHYKRKQKSSNLTPSLSLLAENQNAQGSYVTTTYQIVNESQFHSFMKIDVKSVLKNIYQKWQKIKNKQKRALKRPHPCARTGLQAGKTDPRYFERSVVFGINWINGECQAKV
jgi:hypothetical protein